jgi:formylglycine-generating enzyme required for sulfatase activity
MLSHRVLVGSCLVVAALTANPVWAQPAKPKEGPLGMKFVPLPKATFYMGWDGTKGSAKKTEIKEDFEIAIHTVTQGQWQEVMGKNPSYFSRDGNGNVSVKDIKDEDLKQFPVEMVSWNDAQEFIKKLNEKEKGKGYKYRLPSEVEWEYACRGGAHVRGRVFVPFLLRQADERPVLEGGELQRRFSIRQGGQGAAAESHDQSGIVCAEQGGAV